MNGPPAVQLAPDVWRIPTAGRHAINSFALVGHDGSVTLVDCGNAKAPPKIAAGLAAMGKHPSDVTRIVLTHVHPDHAGGAAEMARRTGASVVVHQGDAESAKSGRVLTPSDPRFLSGRIFTRLVSKVGNHHFPAFETGAPLVDGDVLDRGSGLRVLHTPGHSPGHVSLLHESTRILITGDAIFNFTRLGMRWPPKFLCADFQLTQQTAHILGELDYDVVAFTHGPEITSRARERVRGFLNQVR